MRLPLWIIWRISPNFPLLFQLVFIADFIGQNLANLMTTSQLGFQAPHPYLALLDPPMTVIVVPVLIPTIFVTTKEPHRL